MELKLLFFNLISDISLCTLDIICDTVMGQHVGAQDDSSSPYVRAVVDMTDLVYHRIMSPWLWPDWVFNLHPHGARLNKCLQTLHSFSWKIIDNKIR